MLRYLSLDQLKNIPTLPSLESCCKLGYKSKRKSNGNTFGTIPIIDGFICIRVRVTSLCACAAEIIILTGSLIIWETT